MVFHDALRIKPVDHSACTTPHELHSRYLDEVLRYVSSFIRPLADAEDVTMEVFHASFKHLARLRNIDDPKVWLLGIARRKVADSLRLRYRRQETTYTPLNDFTVEMRTQIETSAMVLQVLSELSQDQREALVLKYSNGLTTLEVARVLNRSESAANSLLTRAREAFYAKGAPLFLDLKEGGNV